MERLKMLTTAVWIMSKILKYMSYLIQTRFIRNISFSTNKMSNKTLSDCFFFFKLKATLAEMQISVHRLHDCRLEEYITFLKYIKKSKTFTFIATYWLPTKLINITLDISYWKYTGLPSKLNSIFFYFYYLSGINGNYVTVVGINGQQMSLFYQRKAWFFSTIAK